MWPFAECSPQFIRSMQRLRCQAKVEAKTLKLHTAGCRTRGWARHYVVFALKNQMNSGNWKNAATWNVATFLIIIKNQMDDSLPWRFSMQRWFCGEPWKFLHGLICVSVCWLSSQPHSPGHPVFLVPSSPHQHPWGFSFIAQNSISYLRRTEITVQRQSPCSSFLSVWVGMKCCACSLGSDRFACNWQTKIKWDHEGDSDKRWIPLDLLLRRPMWWHQHADLRSMSLAFLFPSSNC